MRKILRNYSGYHRLGEQGYNRLLTPRVDKQENKILYINNELLLVRPMNELSMLTLHGRGINISAKKTINSSVLLASNDNLMVDLVGQWSVEKFTLSQISTLFCFLDYQTNNRKFNSDKSAVVNDDIRQSDKDLADNESSIVMILENNSDRLMDLLIYGMINPEKQCLQSMFSFIRNMESYWIAYFLLSQIFSDDSDSESYKLYNACKIYGVSESYFRKLCHNAFTCGPKKQLRMWRAAHSALQLIEKDKSIATIAGNNGYSSSSHFSSEIKSIFGITPREFKKLEGLLHE